MSSDSKSALYSTFGSHIRSVLQPAALDRSSAALQRANAARRRILDLHRTNADEEDEARREIEDLIDDPSDISKLKKLFCSPINLLPSDMKYDAKAAQNAKDYFLRRTAELQAVKSAADHQQNTPKSKFDSIEDFDAWRDRLHTINPSKNITIENQTKLSTENNLELKSDIELTVGALERFENKFSSLLLELPEVPNKLNDEVHVKIRALSKTIHAVNEFIECKTAIMESADNIVEGVKPVPGARNNEIIERIICQAESLTFSGCCDE